jgi:hypothetical protein
MLGTGVLLVASILGQPVEITNMPAEIIKQIDEKVIGDWVLESTHGETPITGEEFWNWGKDRSCVIFSGFSTVEGKKSTYGGAMGWDGKAKTLVSYFFSSDGDVGTTRWTGLGAEKWTGEWVGTYQGQMSKSTAKLEFTKEQKRYEDTTNGKAYVAIIKRKPKPPTPSNHEKLKDLNFFIGTWEAQQEDGVTLTWTFEWAVDKNMIKNQITGKDRDGTMTFSNLGMLGWDAEARRITNWCFNERGQPVTFYWARCPDNKWEGWTADSKISWEFTIVDGNSWSMGSGPDKIVFKRK